MGIRGRRARQHRLAALKFFLPAAIQKAVPFAVLPLLTAAVDPHEYGQMTILTTIMLLCTTVFGFGLDTVIFYSAYRGSARNVAANISSIARLLLVLPLATGLLLSAVASLGFLSFLGVDRLPLAITILASAFYVAGSVLPTSIYRLRQRLLLYGLTIIGFSVVQQATKLILIFCLDDPIVAWSLGDLAGATYVFILSFRTIVRNVRGSATTRQRFRSLLARAVPLVPSRLSQWILQMSDRTLVVGFLGASSGGIYGLAAQLGNISGIFIIEVCRFMLPQLAKAGGEGTSTNRIHRTLPFQFVLSAIFSGGIAFGGPILIGLAFPTEYADAATIVPTLAAAACIAGWYYSITDFIGVTLGKTKNLWIFTVTGAACGVGLNILLIPRFGVLAAAAVSVISYSLMLVLALSSVRKQLRQFRGLTRLTTLYCLFALTLILLSGPLASVDNYLLASVGLGIILMSGLLVLMYHHRSSTPN